MGLDFTKFVTMAVPRYTSYPTAPHFSEDVTERQYRNWLSDLDPQEPISLYLHVPFCRQLCWYCGCNMKLASRDGPLIEYAAMLRREIALLASKLPARMKISHLHWGGGTPTALPPDDLEFTMNVVKDFFELTPGAEIAIESDPRTLSDEMIERIGALGFTRASFGVQEFDPKVQKAINRVQPPEMVKHAVEGLRASGVADINFDLIYGLPYQTTDMLVQTIEECAGMSPDRFALFGYAHVPWMAKKQRMIPEEALPGAKERLNQAKVAGEAMEQWGYVRVGLDHFALSDDPLTVAAKNGELHRNFQGYTTDKARALLGVGCTSIGQTPDGYVQNIAETGAWSRAVEAGTLPISRGLAFTGEDRVRSYVIEQLMCYGQVDLDETTKVFEYPDDWFSNELQQLEFHVSEGLVTIEGNKVLIREEAKSLVRVVAAVFDEYHQNQSGRHSVAV